MTCRVQRIKATLQHILCYTLISIDGADKARMATKMWWYGDHRSVFQECLSVTNTATQAPASLVTWNATEAYPDRIEILDKKIPGGYLSLLVPTGLWSVAWSLWSGSRGQPPTTVTKMLSYTKQWQPLSHFTQLPTLPTQCLGFSGFYQTFLPESLMCGLLSSTDIPAIYSMA